MTSPFVADAAGAYADILEASGKVATFLRETPGIYDPLTDTFTDIPDLLIPCAAMEVKGNPDQYLPLGLVMSEMPTLFVAPQTFPLKAHTPEFVMSGDVVPWNGRTFTAKAVYPFAPDGNVITSRIVVAA